MIGSKMGVEMNLGIFNFFLGGGSKLFQKNGSLRTKIPAPTLFFTFFGRGEGCQNLLEKKGGDGSPKKGGMRQITEKQWGGWSACPKTMQNRTPPFQGVFGTFPCQDFGEEMHFCIRECAPRGAGGGGVKNGGDINYHFFRGGRYRITLIFLEGQGVDQLGIFWGVGDG